MKGKLCVRLATSSRLIFSCLQDFVGCFYFAGESLKFITSHLHTDERKDFLCNYSSLISVKWKKGDIELFHVRLPSHIAKSPNVSKSEIFPNYSDLFI